MQADTAPATDQSRPARHRWAVLLLVSVFLHLIVLGWANGKLAMPASQKHQQATVLARLEPAPSSRPIAKSALQPKPATGKPSASIPRKSQPAKAAIVSDPELPSLAEAGGATQESGGETPVGRKSAAQEKVHIFDQGDAAESAFYYISLPPSALLEYDVSALRQGQTVYGHGKIAWQSDGYHYSVDGEAGILFFNVFNFRSTGLVDESGIAPELYSEKRLRKSETNTHFHRERNLISFSASTLSYPRKGGEQDRASLIWQLSGMGRGGSGSFAPGADIPLFVAGVRDAEIWVIRVLGEEEIETGIGKIRAWHMVRLPRPGSYDQKIDIWLSPEQQWYPVKIRYTETNGEYLDMTLSELRSAAAVPAGLQ